MRVFLSFLEWKNVLGIRAIGIFLYPSIHHSLVENCLIISQANNAKHNDPLFMHFYVHLVNTDVTARAMNSFATMC